VARIPQQHPSMSQISETVVWGPEGHPVVQSFVSKWVAHGPDGMQVYSQGHMITLEDGAGWHPGMKDVPVGLCGECRAPSFTYPRGRESPSLGLTRLSKARICGGRCRRLLCTRHQRRAGSRWMCPRCAASYRRRFFLKRLFFKIEEVD
jgi:hypothetical protein